MKKKIFVLGIDGVPYSLINVLIKKKRFPNLEKMLDKSEMKDMKSVYPVVSSVAWTSYATGCNPAEHGNFGFVDRKQNPFEIILPSSKQRKVETIWNILSEQNKRVIVINVPVTYPIERVNGIMISCFLCPDIHKGVYPLELVQLLKKHDYIIDVEAGLARTNRSAFLQQIFQAMDARFKVAFELMREEWDYFHLHIMETDRLMHFFWYDIENEESPYYKEIVRFFERLDYWIGQILLKLDEDVPFIILSDHGFCGIKREVQMNTWLKKMGYLVTENNSYDLVDYSKNTICYSLLPGRFYINLQGREEKGSVSLKDYESVRQKLKKQLLELADPITGELVINRVFFREEIYSGEYLKDAADIIAYPNRGYDLKNMVPNEEIFTNSVLTGMHTYDDAVIIGKNFTIKGIDTIMDLYPEICNVFGV